MCAAGDADRPGQCASFSGALIAVEPLLHVDGSAGVPRDLHDDEVWAILDAEIAFARIDDFPVIVTGDNLELVVFGNAGDGTHRVANNLTDDDGAPNRCGFVEIDPYERHGQILPGYGHRHEA